MKWAVLIVNQTLIAGCGHSVPQQPPVQPTQIYVQPVQPIHHSITRVVETSASHSSSDDEVILKHAVFHVTQTHRQPNEKKQSVVPKSILKRKKTPDPVWDLD